MKRKIMTILLAVIAVFVCAICLVACGSKVIVGNGNGSDNTTNDNSPQEEIVDELSSLYQYYSGVYRTDGVYGPEYIALKEDKTWYDNNGAIGKYIINEGSVQHSATFTIYYDLSENSEEYLSIKESGNTYGIRVFHVKHLLSGSPFQAYRNMQAQVEFPECPKSLQYESSENGKYYIVSGVGEADGDIVIPQRYKFLPVEEISDYAFSNCRTITSIEVPSKINGIGMRTIGAHAFENCSNLTSAEISSTVSTIGERVFYDCSKLSLVKIEAPISELTEEMFGGCTQLVDVYIPSTIKKINYRAFKDCERVQNVYYAGTAKEWATIQFGISSSHVSTNIGREEPYWANPISGDGRKLIINNSTVTSCKLENVSTGAFFKYKYLTNVTATGEVGDYAFYNSSITSLTTGKTEYKYDGSVGVSACEGCHNLASFSGGGTEINKNAFFDCVELNSVNLRSVTEICEYSFGFCENLTDLIIPQSVLRIGRYAFSGTGLNNVTFTYDTIAYGPSDWIVNKDGKQYIDVSESQTIAAKYLVDDDAQNGYSAYEWERSPLAFTLNSDGNSYGVACNIRGTREVWTTLAHIDIPAVYKGKPVTSINRIRIGQYYSQEGFQNCYSLKSLTIPSSVKETVYYPFSGCSNLTLYCEASSAPSGWSYYNFVNRNDSWNDPKIPVVWNYKNNDKDEDGYVYTVIDNIKYRLKDTSADLLCEVVGHQIHGKLIIPSQVTYENKIYKVKSIGNRAFYFSYSSRTISEVEIPDTVTDIGKYAFDDYIATFKFTGTKAQWANINKKTPWRNSSHYCIIMCSDGQYAGYIGS